MRTLHGGWGHFEYGITGARRGQMKRTAARKRRHDERKAALSTDPDDLPDRDQQTDARPLALVP